jgi:hypothetical protein
LVGRGIQVAIFKTILLHRIENLACIIGAKDDDLTLMGHGVYVLDFVLR